MYPLFEALLGDVWASLYKMKPEIVAIEIDMKLQLNKLFIQKIMEHEQFVSFRQFTRLDDFASAIGTIRFAEMILLWMSVLIKKDVEANHLFGEAANSHLHYDQADLEGDVFCALVEKLEQSFEDNYELFCGMTTEVMSETKQVKVLIKSLVGGMKAGDGEVAMKRIPLRDQILLAEKIAENKQIKEIAEWAGRFKQVARKKQKTKYSESIEKNGVSIGKEIDALLPIELSYYTYPLTKIDFLRRLVEGQTMMYEKKGSEVLGKGPIVLCLDQSDSMSGLDTPSKGFSLALMAIAKKQRRDFCLLLFSSRTLKFTYKKGKVKPSEMMKLATIYLGGGTNFTLVLEEALKVINESRFARADLVLVTDGEGKLNAPFLEAFGKRKKEKGFQVLSLVLGTDCETVQSFSNKVVQITDFNDEASFTAFEV
ncbi:vWA domain-containing protein [Sporosarcina quadrami]|uniref:vWA domain-containing protein n=1 Tax=Sporosarcina quadrami TaxID=2762234 RepID=UPI00296A9D3F|nr:VWA domain-containing protein [Sporosarcina quadrami]